MRLLRFFSPSHLLGPLFRVELRRIARRGLHFRVRLGVGAAVLTTLALVYSSWFPSTQLLTLNSNSTVSIQSGAQFAESFVLWLLLLQLGIALAFTPFLVSASIFEERRKRTVTFLLITSLSVREILFGLVAARLCFVLMVMLSVLPALAFAQFWGGVDFMRLLAAYLVLISSVIGFGGVSILIAVKSESLSSANVAAFFASLGLGLFSAGFIVSGVISTETDTACLACLLFFGIYSGIGIGMSFLAAHLVHGARKIRQRRPIPRRGRNRRHRERLPASDRPRSLPMLNEPRPTPPRTLPQVEDFPRYANRPLGDEDPLLWKETKDRDEPTWWLGIGLSATVAVIGGLSRIGTSEMGLVGRYSAIVTGVPLLFTWCITGSLRAVACIIKERHGRTLESLLMVPRTRREILAAKWRACVGADLSLPIVLAGGFLFGFATLGLSPLALPLVVAYLFCTWRFFLAFGMWLSTVCLTTLRATIYVVAAMLALIIVPLFAQHYFQDEKLRIVSFINSAISPVSSWQTFTLPPSEWDAESHAFWLNLLALVVHVLLLSLGAMMLWRAACRRFERDDGR